MAFLNNDNGIYTSARNNGLNQPITDVEVKNIAGNTVEEQLTNLQASAGKITFTKNIEYVSIFNTDATNIGIFNINGININIPPNTYAEFKIGGTPRNYITVTGSTKYIVTRYV